MLADWREVERLFAREIRDAETATEIQRLDRCGRIRRQPDRHVECFCLYFANGVRPQVLRPREDVKALEPQAEAADLRQRLRHPFGVDSELLRATTHLHSRRLEFEIGVHSNGNTRRHPQALNDAGEEPELPHRFDVDQDPRRDRLREFHFRLARAGEADFVWVHARVEGHAEFRARRHVQAIDQARHVANDGRHGVGFHGVVQADVRGQYFAQLGNTGRQQATIVGIERRRTHARGEHRQGYATDAQFFADQRKAFDRRMMQRGAHWATSGAKARNSIEIDLRSILPLALRGNAASRTSICAGTM